MDKKLKRAEHSPGPWTRSQYTGHESEANDWPGDIVAADGTKVYAGPFSFRALRGKTPEEAEANAILMELSPTMLEVLIDLLPIVGDYDFRCRNKELSDRVRDVIEAATGVS